ncbi:MAG: EutN/CcmL family microcompartment protein [Candidatus Spyradosoma sp.]
MRIAIIKGHVTATVKHPTLEGWRMLIAQPVTPDDSPDGPPQIVIDPLGAAVGQKVVINSDGAEARRLIGAKHSPARWTVLGIVDPAKPAAGEGGAR